MKFLLFADFHFTVDIFKPGKMKDLLYLQRRAEETGCEMMIHAGDFCFGPNETDESREITEVYNNFHIPSYHCLGNHDADRHTIEETLELYRMPNDYYFFDQGGYRFVVTNSNYFKDGDDYVIYTRANHYQHPETIDQIPPAQLAWLKETIETSPYPCLLFSHASFERPDGVKNRDEVRKIIDDANRKKPHSVLMCVNGHYHRDYLRILNNVIYFDMNSASFDYLSNEHFLYPEEDYKQYRNQHHILQYNDCLHAIVTLEGTTVKIEGMESSLYCGVTTAMSGNRPYDNAGRAMTPTVQSATVVL